MHPLLARLFAAVLAAILPSANTAAAQDELRFVMVTHGSAADPFWAAVKAGADKAAAEHNVAVEYRAPEEFDLEAVAALAMDAVAEKPAGLIVSIPNADALAAPIKAAVDAGIPVISINSGFDVAASLGARLHVGQSEYEAGRVAGMRMRDLGGTKALCLNHELGNVALDLRCKGFIDAFEGSVEVLPIGADPDEVQETLSERLELDAEIDVVLALSASAGGEPAVAAVKAIGSDRTVRVASFDTTEPILRAVAGKAATFAVDQQPFLQGYLPVQLLALFHREGVIPVSNVSTGPRLVEADEAARRLGLTPSAGIDEAGATPSAATSEPNGG